MKKLLLIVLIFAAFDAKCQTKIQNDTEYKSVKLKKYDPGFLALKDTAQKYIARFITSLNKNTPGYRFLVKSDFVENGTHEHMWSQVTVYNNGVFKGIFIDSPFELHNIKTGEKVTIKKTGIEDWAIFDRKGMHVDGDFSDKYLKMQKL